MEGWIKNPTNFVYYYVVKKNPEGGHSAGDKSGQSAEQHQKDYNQAVKDAK